jgi:hypothetical protein
MVPGIVERERRIADAQQRDWLAESLVGSARPARPLPRGPGPWRGRGLPTFLHQLPSVRDLRLAIDVALRKSTSPIPERLSSE